MKSNVGARHVALALVVMSLVAPATAWAKARTTRVVFTCMGFARPREITSVEALDFRNGPWGGGFLDTARGAATAAPAGRRLCQVDFYGQTGPREERLVYVMYYYPGENGQAGHIYLPGRGQPWHAMNVASIQRPEMDGTWRVASQRWEKAVALPALAAG